MQLSTIYAKINVKMLKLFRENNRIQLWNSYGNYSVHRVKICNMRKVTYKRKCLLRTCSVVYVAYQCISAYFKSSSDFKYRKDWFSSGEVAYPNVRVFENRNLKCIVVMIWENTYTMSFHLRWRNNKKFVAEYFIGHDTIMKYQKL